MWHTMFNEYIASWEDRKETGKAGKVVWTPPGGDPLKGHKI